MTKNKQIILLFWLLRHEKYRKGRLSSSLDTGNERKFLLSSIPKSPLLCKQIDWTKFKRFYWELERCVRLGRISQFLTATLTHRKLTREGSRFSFVCDFFRLPSLIWFSILLVPIYQCGSPNFASGYWRKLAIFYRIFLFLMY